MLVKKELLTIPVREPPEGKWKEQKVAAVTISKLPRSGRVLSVTLPVLQRRKSIYYLFPGRAVS